MGQRIRASYYCPIHNLFNVQCMGDPPPRYVVCPVCLKPSELCSFSVTQVDDGGMGNDDWSRFVDELMKLSGYDLIDSSTYTNATTKGGNNQDIGRRPKEVKAAADKRTKKIVDDHEMIERAKMDAALYHDGWED